MKIGVFGGSFNPCHLMHKEIVLELLNKNIVDRIVILPTGNFYKKENLLKGEERKKMLELMFENNNRVIISDYEFKNNLISTYRSLDYLQNLYKGDTLYFILGSDNLIHFNSWKRYDYLLTNYHLLVIKRKNIDISSSMAQLKAYESHIHFVDMEVSAINSTEIRAFLREEQYDLAAHSLDERVLSYIKNKKLYSKNYNEQHPVSFLSDEEFMKHYSIDDYEKMSITTDITLFSISDLEKDNYRKKNKKTFGILLVKRKTAPFMNKWCLPGGFLSLDEKLLDCAKRILFIEANIENVYLDQIHTFSDIDRDIRGRVLSVGYIGLIDQNKVLSLKDNASFFQIEETQLSDSILYTFTSSSDQFSCRVHRRINRYGIVSFEILDNEFIAFDHLKMIASAIEYLKKNVSHTDLVFHLLPKEFTLKELQLVYEAILGKPLIDSVFRRSIADKVIKTDKVLKDGGHRPSALYRYRHF